jgi:hypothetical protein
MEKREFKLFKSVSNLLISAAILAMAWVAIQDGAEPTTIGGMAIAAVLVVNGFSISEWFAIKSELQRRQQQDPAEED